MKKKNIKFYKSIWQPRPNIATKRNKTFNVNSPPLMFENLTAEHKTKAHLMSHTLRKIIISNWEDAKPKSDSQIKKKGLIGKNGIRAKNFITKAKQKVLK